MQFTNQFSLSGVLPCASLDGSVSHWFQARQTDGMVGAMQFLSALAGGTNVGVALGAALVVLLVMRKWIAAIMLTLVVPGGALLGEGIKLLVQRQRPMYAGWFVDWGGYSFPSGHTMCATLVYGGLAIWLLPRVESRLWRGVILAGAGVMIMLVGLSRVALGAHYVTDCAAAVVIGSGWLALCSFSLRRVRAARQTNPALARP